MSCYHPLIGIPIGLTENGKKKFLIRSASSSRDPFLEAKVNNGVLIPCGKCIGCRLDYSRQWADRMMLELETMKKGVFVTLTYNDENIHWSKYDENGKPLYGTLVKKDVQLFMKRLRKELSYSGIKIRFYAAGEYGSKNLRPHYHIVLFGVGLSDLGCNKPFSWNDLRQPYFRSPLLEKVWTSGFVLACDVSYETCAYVARYVTKKLNGERKEEYERRNCIPEFCLMSRKPGIGADFIKENPDKLDLIQFNISTPEGGRKIPIPKYYIRQLKGENRPENQFILPDKEKYDKMMSARIKFASDSNLIELQKTDLEFTEYLERKEYERKQKIKSIGRK